MNWDKIHKYLAGAPHQYCFGSVARAFGNDWGKVKAFEAEAEVEGLAVEIVKGVVYVIPPNSPGVVV